MVKSKISCIADTNRSYLSDKEIKRFRQEIVCLRNGTAGEGESTAKLVNLGSGCMAADGFRLLKNQMVV